MTVRRIRAALTVGVYLKVPDFWKLPGVSQGACLNGSTLASRQGLRRPTWKLMGLSNYLQLELQPQFQSP